MTTKQYLQQARKLDQRIDAKIKQIDGLKDLALKITTTLSKGKTNGGPVVDSKTANAIDRIIDLENEINADINALVTIKRVIRDAVSKIDDDRYKLVLELYYLNKMSWEEVAVFMGITWRHTLRLHGEALLKFKKVIECH